MKIFLLILVILFFFFFIFCNAQNPIIKLYDVSENTVDRYTKYPDGTTSTQCHFYFEILIVDTSKSGVGFIVSSSNPNPLFTTIYSIDSAMVFSTEPRVEQNGNYSDTIFTSLLNDSTIINNITINYSCQSIDFGDLTFMYFMANTSLKSTFGFSGVFFFTTKYPIKGFDITSTDALANQIGINSGVYIFNGEFSLDNFIEYNSVQINFLNGNNIEVQIPQSKYQNSNNNNTEIVTVPDINENIILFGKNTHPLFTLISNATDVNPFLFCLGSGGSQSIAQPIYQTNQGIKYLGAFNDYYSAKYNLYLQLNGSLSIIYNATINVTREIPSPLYYTQFIITNTFKNETFLKNSSIFNVHGNSIMKYDGSSSFSMIFGDFQSYITFPFGFINGTNFNYTTKISLLQEPISKQPSQSFLINNYVSQVPADIVATPSELHRVLPKLLYFEIVKLFDGFFLFRITIANGIYMRMKDDSGYTIIGYESLVTNGNGGFFFEFIGIYRSSVFESIDIFNEFGLKTTYFVGDYYSVDPVSKIYSTHKPINSYLAYDISFLKNDIDVTNKSIDNILFFSFDGIDNNTPIFFIKGDDASFSNDLKEFSYGKWNSTISKYQINFRVPGNTQTGIFPFNLMFGFSIPMVSDVLPYTSQLRIKNSYLDVFGPIFQTITKINNNNVIGWSFSISDPINGFLKGKIIVKGEMDSSIYIFNLNETNLISGDIYLGSYEINITIPLKCASQNYIITDVELIDRQNNLNLFSTWNIKASIKTPFFNFLNDSSINKIYKLCNGVNDGIDSSPPVLKSFDVVRFSSGNNLHSIFFVFVAVDEETGLKDDQFPIVYLTSLYLETLQCTSRLVSKNSTSATFSCEIEIPYAFGYNQDIIFSIYGFINNGGYFSGYSSEMLKNNSLLFSMTDIELIKKLYIEKTTSITSNENELWIIGKQFNLKQTVHIKYYGDLTFTQISKPTQVYSVAMFINDTKLTDKPFIIKIVEDPPNINTNSESNEYIVNPIIYDYGDFEPTPIPTIPSTPTPTSTLLPTLSPLPTNKPQKCLGEPECGGESHGYCSLTGCICYEPWVGVDCTSKVIIIPQPSINTTKPTTEIPIEVPSTGNNQTTNNIIFKSLLSIVSIRELDFQSKQVKLFPLERWIFKSISESKSQYISTIENSNLKTTITVHIEWFNSTTNISFANSQLTMNPSTVKYTIEISEYKFSNRLNQLQLVMSVSLETNKKSEDICSSSKFGESSNGDNSNYFKIQIDNHSLYGRFIKRAIIDSYVRSIENVLLDSSMETIKTPSSSQSYIGITIPIYSNSSIIDPDFSVLIDSKSVTSDENHSICNSNPKSKLTTPQLAGIIIGSVGFVAVIIIAITYHFMKNRQNSKLFKSMGLKLKQLNQ